MPSLYVQAPVQWAMSSIPEARCRFIQDLRINTGCGDVRGQEIPRTKFRRENVSSASEIELQAASVPWKAYSGDYVAPNGG